MRDTSYATEICTAKLRSGESEIQIERIFVKNLQQEEIRFSWRKNNRFMTRPLDLPENELLDLFREAIISGIFTEDFRAKLKQAL